MRVATLALTAILHFAFGHAEGQESYADEWLRQPVDEATFESYLGFFAVDHEEPLDAELLETREHEGVRREEWSFTSTPGERVYAHYFEMVTAPTALRRAIVWLHGGSGKDHPYAQRFVESVARAGFSVLVIDMKYWGRRDTGLLTTLTEDDRHDNLYNRPALYLDWVIQTVKDVQRSFDFLVMVKDAEAERIALGGGSRGAVIGFIAAAVDQRFAAAVLLHGGHFDAKEREHLPAACPANYIGRISPTPLLTVNGARDSDFDPETSIRPLLRHAEEPKKHIWTDRGHGQLRDEDRAAIFEWLRTHLE